MGWVVSVMPRPHLPPGKDPLSIVQEAGCAPGPVWTGAENLHPPPGIRSPDLGTTEASVFSFIVCTLLSGILTLSARSPIIWTRKLTRIFLISVQLQAHSSSWRLTRKLRTTIYPSDFCRCILSIFYYTKVVFSSPPILTFLRPLWYRCQWPRSLRRRSTAARPLRLWVWIPPGAWMFVCCECCVLSGRSLCDELITRPEESYRMWRIVVCDQETSNMRRLKPATGLWKIQPQGCNAKKTNKYPK